jgi:hypothetical protein
MEYCNVIAIKDSVVDEAILVLGGSRREVSKKAEDVFLRKCAELLADWGKYTQEDRDGVLSEGHVKMGLFGSICLTWPERMNLAPQTRPCPRKLQSEPRTQPKE